MKLYLYFFKLLFIIIFLIFKTLIDLLFFSKHELVEINCKKYLEILNIKSPLKEKSFVHQYQNIIIRRRSFKKKKKA